MFGTITKSALKYISIWLFIGLILVFVQVILGGITRLTDSGLSITEWELVKGVLPPLNETAWQEAFEKYQTFANKQYESLHKDMSLKAFKRIYFWEWFHRLWARSMGLVFFFPFVFFLAKRWMPKWLVRDLGIVIILAALAAVFGWIMVASGLDKDNRTWVSAYKLSIHLSIATALFSYLFWTFLKVRYTHHEQSNVSSKLKNWAKWMVVLVLVQIVFGGLMAGMRAGAIHPHWPLFLGDNYLLRSLFHPEAQAISEELMDYETKVWIKSVVQVLHRFSAYLIVLAATVYFIKARKVGFTLLQKRANYMMLLLVFVQVLLGILTITNIVGSKVPVVLGVAHQATALLLLISWLYIVFLFRIVAPTKILTE